jgi:hypothetical protein
METSEQNEKSSQSLFQFKSHVKDCLRSYLFLLEVDNDKESSNEFTSFVRKITWNENNITIETLVPEDGKLLEKLITMKYITISFLTRAGVVSFKDSFNIRTLKFKHPLEISHEPDHPSLLHYRLVFEYH